MKLIVFAFVSVFAFAATSEAEILKDCKLYVRGKIVEEIDAFDITGYSTEAPDATIDGGLLDFTKDAKTVTISFSNECDNMYVITFSHLALAKAKSGEFNTLIGRAEIGNANLEKPFTGLLKCSVVN